MNIYEGDKYYELIIPGFYNKLCIWNIIEYNSRSNIIYNQIDNKIHYRIWFSTIKAAEQYINENKPKYSINDILNINLGHNTKNEIIRELIKLNK